MGGRTRSTRAVAPRPRGTLPGRPVSLMRRAVRPASGASTNQVDDLRIVLAHNIGGPTAVSAVTVLSTEI